MATVTKKTAAERTKEEAIEKLRELCPKGSKVYLVLRSVNRGGTKRTLDAFIFHKEEYDKEPRQYILNKWIEDLGLGWKRNKDLHLVSDTVGMDVGFEVVYRVSKVLHGDGYALTREWI